MLKSPIASEDDFFYLLSERPVFEGRAFLITPTMTSLLIIFSIIIYAIHVRVKPNIMGEVGGLIIGRLDKQCNICGQRIREAREMLKLSQEQLAAKLQTEGLGVNQNSISRIETGKRLVADFELVALSKVLGVSMEWLVNGQQETDSKE